MGKSSNEERTRLREKCRIAIAQYIGMPNSLLDIDVIADKLAESSLGLSIQPQDVRLHPLETDAYVWKCLPRSQHLFDKRISKHNIRAYREIIRELGTSIEVLTKHAPVSCSKNPSTIFEQGMATSPSIMANSLDVDYEDHRYIETMVANQVKQGFTHTISELQRHNDDLFSQLQEASNRVNQQELRAAQLQAKVDESSRRVKELESTLQHRNAEAARRTRVHEEYKARIQQVEDWIKDWQTGMSSLRTRSTTMSVDDLDYTSLLEGELVF